jgi:hypothetical protein
LEVEGTGALVVYSIDGRVVLNHQISGYDSFDISALGTGLYIIELNDGNNKVATKALLK